MHYLQTSRFSTNFEFTSNYFSKKQNINLIVMILEEEFESPSIKKRPLSRKTVHNNRDFILEYHNNSIWDTIL